MLLGKIDRHELSELRSACLQLFPATAIDEDFLRTLDLSMLKRAYRTSAKTCHPDLQALSTPQLEQRFFQVNHSYNLINFYLQKHLTAKPKQTQTRCKIIAVGGAKGGVGKSVFSTNLAVRLAAKGFKTVVVDLDLGGANQHLYLGERTLLKNTINDFLVRRQENLQDVMVRSSYGPDLIGGDSSELGTLQLPFTRKLKLLRALKELRADYVVIDLGGDISINILDFFLAADFGLVMTTRESASYIGSYHFVKAALYRKLNRIFGPETGYSGPRDPQFEQFIVDKTMSTDGTKVKTIDELLALVDKQYPEKRYFVDRCLQEFNPCLVVNKIPSGQNAEAVVNQLQGVAGKWLSKKFNYLGAITAQRRIQQSVMELVPVVARYPDGEAAREIDGILAKIIDRAGV